METRDLLLEIGTEEIPARMAEAGAADLLRLATEALGAAGLSPTASEAFCTPRRLAFLMSGLPVRQLDHEEIAYGPSVAVAFGPDGQPTKAAIGFARGQGVELASLQRFEGPRGEVVGVRRVVRGQATRDVLATVLPQVLGRLAFPKSMRWHVDSGPFVRPVHWICCLFGAEPIPFEFAGVQAGRLTRGHRFQAPEPFVLESPSSYVLALASSGVMVRPSDRKTAIRKAMAESEAALGCRFLADDGLLDEVANLVEHPTLLIGRFDEDFLNLPREVLVVAMRAHQRYFAMEDAAGTLVRTFGVIANNRPRDPSVVVRGNERVLAARLYDARFFYRKDLDVGIASMASRLSERLFLKGAGTLADKRRSLESLAATICDLAGLGAGCRADAIRAASLCKADLVSAMVGEFPELQGVMGMYYARAAGESEAVATAVREHYLPRFAGDELPVTAAGTVVAIADRVDSIARCFSVGAIPTGSKDPLALRRQAIGLLKILVRGRWSAMTPARLLAGVDPVVTSAVTAFLAERFHGILTSDHQVPADFANAVLAAAFVDQAPATVVARAEALRDIASEHVEFRDFLDNVFKRVFNILAKAQAEIPGWLGEAEAAGLLDTARDHTAGLPLPAEKRVESLRVSVMSLPHDNPRGILDALFSFREPLAAFFGSGKEGVPVLIAPEPVLRLKRLALLRRVQLLFDWFADFSKISSR